MLRVRFVAKVEEFYLGSCLFGLVCFDCDRREHSDKPEPRRYTQTVPEGEYLQYGGLAIIEGVMMRSPKYFAVACRAPNGQIVLQTEPVAKGWLGRQKWLRLPFLRGPFALIDSIALGNRAMQFASQVQLEEKYQKKDADSASDEGSEIHMPAQHGGESINDKIVAAVSVVATIAMVLIFMFVPQLLGETLRKVGVTNERILNLVSGCFKLALFLGYVLLIRRMKVIYRLFQYHGAEHKAINTMEARQELTMENCQKQTRLHPRCGTNFAIIVLLLDIAVMTFVMRYPLGYENAHYLVNLGLRALINIPILMVVAGVAYELIRLAGKFRNSWLVGVFFAPGLASQFITTAPPEDDQIEVALVALRAVIEAEAADRAPELESEAEPVTT